MTDTALTVDQAVAEMIAPVEDAPEPQEEQTPDAEEAPAETEADPPAEVAPDESEEETPEGEEEPEEQAEAIAHEPPQWWDAEAKAKFAALTPELQATVFAQEEKREAVVAKAKAEASQEKTAAKTERETIGKVTNALSEWLPKAKADFDAYYGEQGFDLEANIAEYGEATALVLQARYNKHLENLHQVAQAKNQADHQAKVAWQMEQREALKEVCPDLADPREGKTREKELASYLLDQGFKPADLELVSAPAINIAWKAYRYDKAQAEAKAKSQAPKKPVVPALKPTATPNQSTASEVTKLKQRLAKTNSIDDAVELMLAEGRQAQRRA